MRVLICGGRYYEDYQQVSWILHGLKPDSICHGDASGADRLAHLWAMRNLVDATPYPADWSKHGRAAGPIRNQHMLDDFAPDVVVAFPGGRGTADMVRRAKAAGLRVIEVSTHQEVV